MVEKQQIINRNVQMHIGALAISLSEANAEIEVLQNEITRLNEVNRGLNEKLEAREMNDD